MSINNKTSWNPNQTTMWLFKRQDLIRRKPNQIENEILDILWLDDPYIFVFERKDKPTIWCSNKKGELYTDSDKGCLNPKSNEEIITKKNNTQTQEIDLKELYEVNKYDGNYWNY